MSVAALPGLSVAAAPGLSGAAPPGRVTCASGNMGRAATICRRLSGGRGVPLGRSESVADVPGACCRWPRHLGLPGSPGARRREAVRNQNYEVSAVNHRAAVDVLTCKGDQATARSAWGCIHNNRLLQLGVSLAPRGSKGHSWSRPMFCSTRHLKSYTTVSSRDLLTGN